jgi:hypothetical protein
MKVDLRYPYIDKNAPPSVQVEQTRMFLFDLINQLQLVINSLPDDMTLAQSTGGGGGNGKDGRDGKDGKDGRDGKDGKDGVDGKDGYTPIKGVDYFDGKDGKDGVDGKDGYTPQKGADYFTDDDVSQIRDSVISAMPGEEDPTVPDWAKASTKPSYSAEEVGARPNTWMPTAADVGARPITWTPTAAEVGARPSSWTPTAAEVGAVPTTRKVNGQALSADVNLDIPDSLAELADDAAHRTVSDTEKGTWNAKSDFSGSYNDLTDKPSIPSVTGLASTDYVDQKVASIVDSSPEALNTLSELAASLGNDPNFATTVSENIGKKVDKTTTVNGHALSGNVTVSKSDVGLGNVPNVATNDQTPTFTEASSLVNINTGEKVSTLFGKIKKAITDLIAHIASKSNPHGVTKSQLGLGDVENKSSETIRSEITKENVTSALGYTPVETVPTKVSELTNDSGYQTALQVNALINNALGVIENGTY